MVLKGIENSTMALDFMKAVAPNMSIGNTDGIGYSAINSNNQLFMEKWHNNRSFLDTENVLDVETLKALETAITPFKTKVGITLPSINYTKYGEVTREDLRTVTMHTRFATCGKTFENTHPFIDNGTSLIHNGVISNSYILGLNKISTCDSENALQLYNTQKLGFQNKTEKFQEFIDKLRGYWAFAFLAKDENGQYMLDVVREGASLYWALLPEIGADCVIFATTSEIIETGVRALNLPIRDKIWTLTESNYHRFNAVTGEFIDNYILEDSVLNTASSYYCGSGNSYYGKKWNERKNGNVQDKKVTTEKENEESYEGYKSNKVEKLTEKKFKEAMQGVSDDLSYDGFYDIDELLIDRLYDYDKLMGTSYGNSFEDLPPKVKLFIEKKEEEDYIVFDNILEMIESYQETDKVSGIYKIFKEKKRA